MPRQKQLFSRRCPYCRTRFTTTNRRKEYDHPNCRKYAFDERRTEKLRKATEILRKHAEL